MNKSVKKALSITGTVILWLVVAALAVSVVRLVIGSVKGKAVYFFNYSFFRIATESMAAPDKSGDGINAGDYILVKKVAPSEVKENDVISFYSSDPAIKGKLNTHRVISISGSGDTLTFETKGDNNLIADRYPVYGADLAGVFVKKLPVVTLVSSFLTGRFAFVLLILVPAMWLVIANLKKVQKCYREITVDHKVAEETERLRKLVNEGKLTISEDGNVYEIQNKAENEENDSGDRGDGA